MGILQPLYTQNKDRAAAKAGNTLITYGRLCADIDSMAHWLLGSGLEPGDRITIHVQDVPNPTYWDWIMHLGAIRAGLANSTGAMPPAVARTGAIGPYAAAVGELSGLHKLANPNLKLPFDPTGTEPLAEQLEIDSIDRKLDGLEERTARLLKTSGTTGTPKVIHWDSAMLAGRLEQVRATGDMDADTKLFTALGMITTTGLRYPLACWQLGGFAILASIGKEKTDPKEAVETSNFLAASPFRMQDLLRTVPGEWAGRESRVIELFGGRVPPVMREEALKRCCTVLRTSYGATEVGRVAAGDADLIDRDPGAVGIVEPRVTVQIVDKDLNELPHGERGMVRIKSDYMCHSYAGQGNEPDARSPFRDGWFYPGDTGVLYEDGMFAITGRLSEAINISGAKMSPILLEERVMKLPAVRDVCVLSLPLDRGDVLCVAVVCHDQADMKIVRQNIARLMPLQFPPMVIRLREIPRNAMGRIPRQRFAATMMAQVKQMQQERQERQESAAKSGSDTSE